MGIKRKSPEDDRASEAFYPHYYAGGSRVYCYTPIIPGPTSVVKWVQLGLGLVGSPATRPKPDLTKRFRELVANLSDTELGAILGIAADGASKLRVGDTKSLKLHMALKLARELQVSPWYLAGVTEPEGRVDCQSSTKPRVRPRGQLDEDRDQNAIFKDLRGEIRALNARIDLLEATLEKRRPR